jgi:FeS assembly SUF system protein
VPLPVIAPANPKVEQLKQEAAADAAKPQAAAPATSAPAPIHPKLEKHPNTNSLVSRFVDPRKSPAQKAIEEKVIDACRLVYDPEIPVNIYDLGLIYRIDVDPDTNVVNVQMTLTAPGCPVAGELVMSVQRRVEAIPEVPEAVVELVWDPPWSREMMSEAAQLELGLL